MDDMIVSGDDKHEKQSLKENLVTQFEMNDLEKLKYFLSLLKERHFYLPKKVSSWSSQRN